MNEIHGEKINKYKYISIIMGKSRYFQNGGQNVLIHKMFNWGSEAKFPLSGHFQCFSMLLPILENTCIYQNIHAAWYSVKYFNVFLKRGSGHSVPPKSATSYKLNVLSSFKYHPEVYCGYALLILICIINVAHNSEIQLYVDHTN